MMDERMMDVRMKSQSSTMMMILLCEVLSLDQAVDRVSVHLALYSADFLWVVVAVMQTLTDDDEGMDLSLIYYY